MMLDNCVDFLKNQHFNFDRFAKDKRINSTINEASIIELLSLGLDILKAKKRDWFDFFYQGSENFYPKNLKIIDLSTDNLNCKPGNYYILTDKIKNFYNQISWKNFLENFKQKNNENYYFLVINKNNLSDTFLTSLRNINILTPNENNLPFQTNLQVNKLKIYRQHDEAREALLTIFRRSLKIKNKSLHLILRIKFEYK